LLFSHCLFLLSPTHNGEQVKKRIVQDLPKLVAAGVCKASDGYQGILNSIAEDIRNQRVHRRQRKEELAKLKHVAAELANKKEYYGGQIEYYQQYVNHTDALSDLLSSHPSPLRAH